MSNKKNWHQQKMETDPEYAERARARARKWYHDNKAKAHESQMEWRKQNIEAYREYQREYHTKWREENKEQWLAICRASYHRRKNAEETTDN